VNRRDFLIALSVCGLNTSIALAGRNPPSEEKSCYEVVLPDFMADIINNDNVDYLNETIPTVFADHRDLFPMMDMPPQYIVVNTLNETLINHGSVQIAADLLNDETMTLFEVQYLLATLRFSSVATPHRGENLDNFGKYVYLKQHPQNGYQTPEHLLLEEMIHAQQDMTVMRYIIETEEHNPTQCLHAQLKGISELGAHYFTDVMIDEPDYVFVMDDGIHCENAASAITLLAERIAVTEDTLIKALTHDVNAYTQLDAIALNAFKKHIWEMVTTWRYARDAEGNATDIAPAFMTF